MKVFFLYLPFLLAYTLSANPNVSFWISWFGSISLIYLVVVGVLKPNSDKGTWLDYPLRPLYVPHFIFAGYMSLSSIFYFLSLYGYEYFEKVNQVASLLVIERAAMAQSLYYLGHAGLLHGLLLTSNYSKPRVMVKTKSITDFSLKLALVFTIFNVMLSFFPQLAQLIERMSKLSAVAASIALALAIPERKTSGLIIALIIFGFNLLQAILSGWKESILIPIILLGAFLVPVYRFKIVLLGVPLIVFLIFLLPTFNGVFRANAWDRGVNRQLALQIALDALQKQEGIRETNWEFLTGRFSEINIFCKYIENVPKHRPFYGTQIINQGLQSLIPRIILPNKGNTEEIVMKRVWENGVVSSVSKVSAKPQIVVDGYLSFGFLGAWMFCLFVGITAARISVLAEQLFGGYFLGTGLMFSGLFNVYWRGNCFEFMLNNIVWSFVVMIVLYFLFLTMGVIKKV